jgi:hypothetical protein
VHVKPKPFYHNLKAARDRKIAANEQTINQDELFIGLG